MIGMENSINKELSTRSSIRKKIPVIYAANVLEDWNKLSYLLKLSHKERVKLVILTNIIGNPISPEDQQAYQHAYQYVYQAFLSDKAFSDIQEFINSFEKDNSQDIVTISAKKILNLIESGKIVYRKKVERLSQILREARTQIVIVPGPYESLDVIENIDREVASYYLNVSKKRVCGLNILGIGGQNIVERDCPQVFQNRDYVDGTEQANEELRKLFVSDVDILVSYTPVRYFTTSEFEKLNVREYLSDFLPGKVILTSQELDENFEDTIKTATDAALVKGGFFYQTNQQDIGYFWKFNIDKNGLVDKELFEIERKYNSARSKIWKNPLNIFRKKYTSV